LTWIFNILTNGSAVLAYWEHRCFSELKGKNKPKCILLPTFEHVLYITRRAFIHLVYHKVWLSVCLNLYENKIMNKLSCAVSKVAVCHVTWLPTCTLAHPHWRLIGKVVCVCVCVCVCDCGCAHTCAWEWGKGYACLFCHHMRFLILWELR
jgi:hypothetical protein